MKSIVNCNLLKFLFITGIIFSLFSIIQAETNSFSFQLSDQNNSKINNNNNNNLNLNKNDISKIENINNNNNNNNNNTKSNDNGFSYSSNVPPGLWIIPFVVNSCLFLMALIEIILALSPLNSCFPSSHNQHQQKTHFWQELRKQIRTVFTTTVGLILTFIFIFAFVRIIASSIHLAEKFGGNESAKPVRVQFRLFTAPFFTVFSLFCYYWFCIAFRFNLNAQKYFRITVWIFNVIQYLFIIASMILVGISDRLSPREAQVLNILFLAITSIELLILVVITLSFAVRISYLLYKMMPESDDAASRRKTLAKLTAFVVLFSVSMILRIIRVPFLTTMDYFASSIVFVLIPETIPCVVLLLMFSQNKQLFQGKSLFGRFCFGRSEDLEVEEELESNSVPKNDSTEEQEEQEKEKEQQVENENKTV